MTRKPGSYSYLPQIPSPSPHSRATSQSDPRRGLRTDTQKDSAPRLDPKLNEQRLSNTKPRSPSLSIPNLILPEEHRERAPLPRPASYRQSKSLFPGSVPSVAMTSAGGFSGDKTYHYKPLGKDEFRLLVLWPSRSAQIRCQIMHCSLQNPEFPYTAISYAWGDVGDKRTIRIRDAYTEKVEEVEIHITASLETALRALRKRDEITYIWADALSIDQQNSAEKKEQVRKMTQIYEKANAVAIWLGLDADDSELAMELIYQIGIGEKLPQQITERTREPFTKRHLAATAALFDRDYWHRLWVVQEVFNASHIMVFCGPSCLRWQYFEEASDVFWKNESLLLRIFPIGTRSDHYYSKNTHLSVPQALRHRGPSSILEFGSPGLLRDLEAMPDVQLFARLLTVMKMFRRKLSSDPKDKVFGALGVLPPTIREEIQIDYEISVKDVYINVVDILLRTTGCLDVICEAIHFPTHANNLSIPSWVPDWSHVPECKPISSEYPFYASGKTTHRAMIVKSKLEISAIYLGIVEDQGIALGNLCTLSDYLMAFLHWRSMLLDTFAGTDTKTMVRAQEDFCLMLCLHHLPPHFKSAASWLAVCYHVFSLSIQVRMPSLAIDEELKSFARKRFNMSADERLQLIKVHMGTRMMGRRFFVTREKRIGLGTGFLMRGDIIVVPLGCSTPIVLRPEGKEYRFVGDVFIDGYMRGRAIEESDNGVEGREMRKFVLH